MAFTKFSKLGACCVDSLGCVSYFNSDVPAMVSVR